MRARRSACRHQNRQNGSSPAQRCVQSAMCTILRDDDFRCAFIKRGLCTISCNRMWHWLGNRQLDVCSVVHHCAHITRELPSAPCPFAREMVATSSAIWLAPIARTHTLKLLHVQTIPGPRSNSNNNDCISPPVSESQSAHGSAPQCISDLINRLRVRVQCTHTARCSV